MTRQTTPTQRKATTDRNRFWRRGEPFVWASGAAAAAVLLMTAGLVAVTVVNGLGVFWPAAVAQVRLADGSWTLGERIDDDVNPDTGVRSVQFKTGNREIDPERQDFHWYPENAIAEIAWPSGVMVFERTGNGNFYGFPSEVTGPLAADDAELPTRFEKTLAAVAAERRRLVAPLEAEIAALTRELRGVKDRRRKAEHELRNAQEQAPGEWSDRVGALEAALAAFKDRQAEINARSDAANAQMGQLLAELRKNAIVMQVGEGRTASVPLLDIVRASRPNDMGWFAKLGHYLSKIKELLLDWPRESNTEGGLFPAIFGTVMLVFLMSAFCFPLGVLAGVYLGEYAKEGPLVRLVRIAVNNLAGIPSIVYGMFGLGFFVYGVGQSIDRWFFPEWQEVSQPVFGTGGVLWASLTLGLLTVPVVIVATEESLRTIPRAMRESSYALGSTKLQTLSRVLLPMASPGILTGFILAMARAAGEVAPLMITGAIKIVSDLAVDGSFPYFHPDRKFMHLGFHIYDIGFQSPNVEATKPMVYVTTFLLVAIVLAMSSVAIYLRNRMRRRYQTRGI